jgi:hypothetical protein
VAAEISDNNLILEGLPDAFRMVGHPSINAAYGGMAESYGQPRSLEYQTPRKFAGLVLVSPGPASNVSGGIALT